MEDKLRIVEPLIDKREEQEQIIERVEKELEQRRDVLVLLKKEERLIRAKDESGFNELRSELPEAEIYDEFFERDERWPEMPQKQVEKLVERKVEKQVEKSPAKPVNIQDIDIDLEDEVSWKDCISGAATWFLVFGGIILLAGMQTAAFEIIEGGIRSIFAGLMISCGLFIAGIGAFLAWNNRKDILYMRALEKAEATTDSEAETETEIEVEETVELVDNEDYPAQYEEYKHKVMGLLRGNLAKQADIKNEAYIRRSADEIKAAKAMLFRIDKVLYPGILTARYVLEGNENKPVYYTSAELKKIIKVVKSGKVDNLKKACELYEKYVTMSNGKIH